MASATLTTSSSKETTNYARLCRLLVDIGTGALRDTLDAIHPPANLPSVLAANKQPYNLLKRRRLSIQYNGGNFSLPPLPQCLRVTLTQLC